ncbi:hypothetical protein CEXT_366731, partial [Caerostris extrusa]
MGAYSIACSSTFNGFEKTEVKSIMPRKQNKFSNLNVDESTAGVDITTQEPKLPPIMVKYANNLKVKIAEISLKFKDDIRIKIAGEHLKIFPKDIDNHRAITRYLNESKLEYFVITPKSQRPLKAVLKGIPLDYTVEEIEEGLRDAGLKVDN